MEKRKGIIYKRVSDREQVDGTSLEFQEQECRRYCERNGIDVVSVFTEEGESAKDLSLQNRQAFLHALEYCRKHKGEIAAFVVLRVDRFARNTEDHFAVRKILLDYGTTLHSVTESIGNKPSEKFFETMLAAAAEYDNGIRKQRCSDGMSSKVNQGIWPWRPPIGYKCMFSKKHGLKKLTADPVDEVVFPIIQQALKDYATGQYSQGDLARRLDNLGLKAVRGKKTDTQFTDRILGMHLKFYAGMLVNPWTKETVKGLHAPMISELEMHKIIAVRQGRSFKPKINKNNPEFPLKPSVRCGECSRPLTASHSKGYSATYAYYHCYKDDCPEYGKAIPQATIEKEMRDRLVAIKPKQDFLDAFKKVCLDRWKERGIVFEADASKYQHELAMLEQKRKRIYEMREDGSYTKDEFLERKQGIENEVTAAKISMSESRIEQFDIEAALEFATQFAGDLDRQWFDLPVELRPQFQRLVFPDGIPYFRGSGVGTAKLGLIYETNQRFTAGLSNDFQLVDPTGLEPVTSCLQSRRSTK
jgi:site-specific DNA recombinase